MSPIECPSISSIRQPRLHDPDKWRVGKWSNLNQYKGIPGLYLFAKGAEVLYIGRAMCVGTRAISHLRSDRFCDFTLFVCINLQPVVKEMNWQNASHVIKLYEAIYIQVLNPTKNLCRPSIEKLFFKGTENPDLIPATSHFIHYLPSAQKETKTLGEFANQL